MNEKTNKKNREWVKTFAIIFLAVMLVLTFFSNTIMNMNLPEVSTDNIRYGSIKTQIRTSGLVMSVDNYSVTFPSTREIQSVNFRTGDAVNKGDVLFVLAEGDSTELDSAKESYADLKYEYDRMLISSSGSGDFADKNREVAELTEDLNLAKQKKSNYSNKEKAISDKKAEVSIVEGQIKACEKQIDAKKAEIAELEAEKSAIGYTPSEDEVLIGRNDGITYEEYASAVAIVDAADAELEAAEKALDDAKDALIVLERELAVLERNLEKLDKELSDIPTEDELDAKKKEIQQSDRNIEELERNLKYLKQDFYDATVNFDLEKLYDKFKDKQKDFKEAKKKYEQLLESGTASEAEIRRAEQEYENASDIVDDAYDLYQACLTDEKNAALSEEKALGEAETTLKYALEDNTELKEDYNELVEKYKRRSEIEESFTGGIGYDGLKNKIEAKESELDIASDAVKAAEGVYNRKLKEKERIENSVDKTRNEYKFTKVKEYELLISEKENELDALEMQLDSYEDTLEEQQEELAELESGNSESEEALDERIKSLERQLAAELASLEDSKKDATEEEQLKQLEIAKLKTRLDKAYEEVQKLESRVASNEIVAPVSGIIESVNVQPGQKTEPEATLAEISLSERGFTMTATVSQEQAARLRPGLVAEITSWVPHDSEIKVTLDAIKSDTANPGSRQKVLEFAIEGNVDPGQNLSIAVGDKNASYDNTVPNTAIREDSTGKYILIVESKSTAISTRYIARKVPVMVIASDDTRSAISGEFDNYAYVIATSSAPINDGDQVKLNEN